MWETDMIAITELRVVQPHDTEAGTLLLGGAHYDDPPMFVFKIGEEKFRFDLGGKKPFKGEAMAINLHPYILSGSPTLLVDSDERISPTQGDIPIGSVVLIGDEACMVITINHGTSYVRIDGERVEDPTSYDRIVAFPKWQLVVPSFGDGEWLVAYDSTSALSVAAAG
jgi:hypothetical protein